MVSLAAEDLPHHTAVVSPAHKFLIPEAWWVTSMSSRVTGRNSPHRIQVANRHHGQVRRRFDLIYIMRTRIIGAKLKCPLLAKFKLSKLFFRVTGLILVAPAFFLNSVD
jgi:hypothetical protein